MKSLFKILLLFFFLAVTSSCSEDKKEQQAAKKMINDKWPPIVENTEVQLKKISLKNYYVIFDGSGSMKGSKLADAKKALRKFIQIIPKNSNIGLAAFDMYKNSERAPLGSSKNKILQELDKIKAGGSTPLGKTIDISYGKLTSQGSRQLGYGEYNLIIITDGKATDSKRLVQSVDRILAESPIIIHTIGFHIGQGHPLNQRGKIYYKTAKNLEELSMGLENVLAETEKFTVTDF